MAKIGLLGCGNLVSAIISGFDDKSYTHNFQFYCYTPSQKRAFDLSQKIRGKFCDKPKDLENLDIYLFGFKPQAYEKAVEQYRKIIPSSASIWSLLAGVSSKKIRNDFPGNPVLRIMPNTATRVHKGITLYHHDKENLSDYRLQPFKEIFGQISKLFYLQSDDMIDRVTGVSASGPALLFEFAYQLDLKLQELGLSKNMSEEIVTELFIGSGSLMASNKKFKKLREQVTSKKGVTFEALSVFKSFKFEKMVSEAIQKAYAKSLELRKE